MQLEAATRNGNHGLPETERMHSDWELEGLHVDSLGHGCRH